MLGKLIKYDNRALRRTLLPLTLAILAASLLCTAALRFMLAAISNDTTGYITIMYVASAGVFVFLNAIAILVYPTVTIILIMVNFYRNLYTDEGYLTFTLPVRTEQILASKFITAIMWSVISTVVAVGCGSIILVFGTAFEGIWNLELISGIWDIMLSMFDFMGASVVLYVINTLSWLIYVTIILFLSITIGSIAAKKHKVLASIGIYYLFNLATSIITNIISVIMMFAMAVGDPAASVTFATLYSPLINIILYLGFAAAALVVCRHMMKSNLNLP